MEGSIADLEHRCLLLMEEEQRKIAPDNALIATLCDTVRFCREVVAFALLPIRAKESKRRRGCP
jgi:hypothetical protein